MAYNYKAVINDPWYMLPLELILLGVVVLVVFILAVAFWAEPDGEHPTVQPVAPLACVLDESQYWSL